MKIDVHAHIMDRQYLDELQQVANLTLLREPSGKTYLRKGRHSYMYYREEMFDIDWRLREMDRKGIDMRILSLTAPNVYVWGREAQADVARRINDATARICKAHPDRFLGLASLPLKDVEAALTELERATQELGMVGAMIGSNIDGAPLNDPRFEPVWARINQLRLPVFEHPMLPKNTEDMEEFELPLRLGFVFDTTLAVTRMIYSGIFERYPDFPYIMAHTGGTLLMLLERLDNGYRLFPDCREKINKLPSEYAGRLYYDTTSFFEPTLMLAHGYVGADRLLFGTDDPLIDSDTGYVERLPISREDKAKILGGNAARLFKLKAGALA
jgi:aminocarboxymuconate-semialdehyde decarboxylase